MELGPSRVDKNLNLIYNPYSWNANASVIFLDQPVNVGFSYSGSAVSTTIAAAKDVYALLTLFFKQFPEYAHQDFHISGESYAGHYIPVFTSEILGHKKRNINLKSILIGNGLTDGYTQYEYYRPMACGDGGWPAVLGESECQAMDNALPRCQSLIESCYQSESVWSCVPASIYCNNALIGPFQRTGQNVYDVRGKCEDTSNLCYSMLGYISKYLNKKEVQEALGVEVNGYESCNFDINRNFLFQGDWMQPFHRLVPNIIAEIPVLIYAVSITTSSSRPYERPYMNSANLFSRVTLTSFVTGSATKPGLKRSTGPARKPSTKSTSRIYESMATAARLARSRAAETSRSCASTVPGIWCRMINLRPAWSSSIAGWVGSGCERLGLWEEEGKIDVDWGIVREGMLFSIEVCKDIVLCQSKWE